MSEKTYVRTDGSGAMRIGNTRVMLDSIVAAFDEGHSAETIQQQYPALTLEEVIEKAKSKFYTVVSGDSLSKIAKEFYGDAMKYPEIFEANKPMLKDPDLIYPGQVLRIPPLGGSDDAGGEGRDLKGIQ